MKFYTRFAVKLDLNYHSSFPLGPKIIVANHPTTLDPFILTGINNGTSVVLIKKLLFDIPIFGRYLALSGHIPVDKNDGRDAFLRATEALKKGLTIVVFIEGTLSKSVNKFEKPKTGAIRLALVSGLPIIPVGISVEPKRVKNILTSIKGIQEWGRWYFNGKYSVTIGEPLIIGGKINDKTRVVTSTQNLLTNIKKLVFESKKRISK